MLIIAIPKSASSSLISTLCKLHNIEDKTFRMRKEYQPHSTKANSYKRLSKWHSEIVDMSTGWEQETSKTTGFYKHHFPPTDHNQQILATQKKVILLRSPEEIVLSHFKGDKTGVFPILSEDFIFCFTKKSWLKRAHKIGLINELQKFYDGWMNHSGDKLIITYEELISQPQLTINKIEEYFGLDQSEYVDLQKEKYFFHSQAKGSLVYRIYRRFKISFKFILRPWMKN